MYSWRWMLIWSRSLSEPSKQRSKCSFIIEPRSDEKFKMGHRHFNTRPFINEDWRPWWAWSILRKTTHYWLCYGKENLKTLIHSSLFFMAVDFRSNLGSADWPYILLALFDKLWFLDHWHMSACSEKGRKCLHSGFLNLDLNAFFFFNFWVGGGLSIIPEWLAQWPAIAGFCISVFP